MENNYRTTFFDHRYLSLQKITNVTYRLATPLFFVYLFLKTRPKTVLTYSLPFCPYYWSHSYPASCVLTSYSDLSPVTLVVLTNVPVTANFNKTKSRGPEIEVIADRVSTRRKTIENIPHRTAVEISENTIGEGETAGRRADRKILLLFLS